MAIRRFANAPVTTLVATVGAADTLITVASAAAFPALTPYICILDKNEPKEEVVLVTAVAGSQLTITRGYDSTTAFGHDAGAVIAHGVAAIDFREANEHVNSSAGVHGVAGSVVGTSDAQSLMNKTLGTGTIIQAGTSIQASSITDSTFSGGIFTNQIEVRGDVSANRPIRFMDTGGAIEYGYIDKLGVVQGQRLRGINLDINASPLVLDTPTGQTVNIATFRRNNAQVAAVDKDGNVVAPNIDVQAWQNLTLTAGRVTYDSTPQYRKVGTKRIHLRGTVRKTDFSPIDTAPYLLATLPVGYRPTHALERYVAPATLGGAGTTGACRIEVSSNGQINVWTQDSPTWVGIEGWFWLD